MNNTFSLGRTLLYARKHYVENARYYGYTLLLFLLMLSVWACYIRTWGETASSFTLFAVLLMIAFICLVTRISSLSHYEQRIIPLSYTLPVTTEEKYLFIWFNSTVVATVLYALILCPVTYAAGKQEILKFFSEYPAWLMIFTIQAGLLLSCSWVKGNPLKAFLPLAGAFFLYHAIYTTVLRSWGFYAGLPFSEIGFHIDSGTAYLRWLLPEQISQNAAYTILFGFWILVAWIVGYFKFKERTLK